MSAKRSLHHVPGPREQGAGRLLLTFHRALALQRKGTSGEMQKSLPVPGLESGEGRKWALEVFTRKVDAWYESPLDGFHCVPLIGRRKSGTEAPGAVQGALWWAVPLTLHIQLQTFSESGIRVSMLQTVRLRLCAGERPGEHSRPGSAGSQGEHQGLLSGAILGSEAATFFSCHRSKLGNSII